MAARLFNTGGTRRVREVAAPLPDSGDRPNSNRKTVGAAHTRVGAVCPQTPEGFSSSVVQGSAAFDTP